MCRFLREEPELIKGARVLELGCGTGVAGLYAACMGASRVLLTDGGPPVVIENLHLNVERHAPRFPPGTRATAGHFLFGGEALPGEADNEAFDLILGSDITYSVRYDRDALAVTLRALLQRHAHARVVLAHEHRRSTMFDVATLLANEPARTWDADDYALGIFLDTAREQGLRVEHRYTEGGSRATREVTQGTEVVMTTDLSIIEIGLEVDN